MHYIVIDGVFADSDGSTKGPGQRIELDEHMAAHHGARVRPALEPAGHELGFPDVQAHALPEPPEPRDADDRQVG